MIIFDNHLHLRRNGLYLKAVNDFKNSGGTHFVLCQLPMIHLVIKYKTYKKCYEETLNMAEEIRSKIDIGVFVTLGPYPVDYIKLKDKFGRKETINIMKKGMDLASYYCQECQSIAIGEIGRPHFPVSKQTIIDSNEILFYGMKKAKDVDVPIVLHTESTTPEQCKEFSQMGKKVGLNSQKIVKHYSPPLIYESENYGLMPSIIASRRNILSSLKKGTRFLMETDYIDDISRPGVVLGPKTVPRRTLELMDNGLMSEEQVIKIHKENPEKTYNINLDS